MKVSLIIYISGFNIITMTFCLGVISGGIIIVDINIKIGGEAGQGIQTIGLVLSRTFVRDGFYVYGNQFYLSRVRGGHNYFHIRVSDHPVYALDEKIDVLVALDNQTIPEHIEEVKEGFVLADESIVRDNVDEKIVSVPFTEIAKDVSGKKLFSNTVAVGAVFGLLCYDLSTLKKFLSETFKRKGDEVVEKNIKAAQAGYDYVKNGKFEGICNYNLSPQPTNRRILINGNDSVGVGALAAGVQFLSAYPMTPSTGVMTRVAAHADDFNAVVEQAEDEIAAINMAIGASFAGVRAMTTTSGGGFCLMTEGLGLSGITETPIVIFLGQRPGPATGLPTMTEQGDLNFVLHAAQGEFPRCVLAPRTAKDAFNQTRRAFDIADKYQIPVLILSDQHLADGLFTYEMFDTSGLKINRHLLEDRAVGSDYQRYTITESGISPRAIPGQNGALVVADSDEHNESGHIDQTTGNRIRMNEKRLRKVDGLTDEMQMPAIHGIDGADISLIGWGSTYGPLAEAVEILNRDEVSINLIHFSDIYPFSHDTVSLLDGLNTTICVENNATGQFARLLRAELGFEVSKKMLRYDGLPFTPQSVIRELKGMGVI
ncbi:MAG: 2-oxoglutarate ferredoxin oxidoreductase subunit alpha [Methanohalophilus sp. T328-1]|nr:MAG: 2-oxoglutarate ferredoxin oxidoreductase subunit alpha [Methanohalophilus sp. T328-1]